MRTLRLMLCIPAVALLFLPYTSNTSPWDAVRGFRDSFAGPQIALMGGPFFVAVLIFIVRMQICMKKTLPKTERIIFRIFAFAALACGLVIVTLAGRESRIADFISILLTFGIPFLAAVFLMYRARRLSPDRSILIALMAAWIPNAIMCGIAFWGGDLFTNGWQVGAYMSAFTIFLYGAEIALEIRRHSPVLANP